MQCAFSFVLSRLQLIPKILPYDPYDVYEYSDYEEFYEDNDSDFDGIDDAEEYYNDAWEKVKY